MMRCLFIGGSMAGKVLSVSDELRVRYVSIPNGFGEERYIVGEIANAAGAITPICYFEGTDPLETLLDHYESNAQR